MVLQFTVLVKVQELSDKKKDHTNDMLFKHLCHKQAELPFEPTLGEPSDGAPYWNCAPSTPVLLASENIDLDGDGLWTHREAMQLHQQWKERHRDKPNTLPVTWTYLHRMSKLGPGHVAGTKNYTRAEMDAATHHFTGIPMAWMGQAILHLQLCAAADKNLCGNLEARGVLRQIFTRQPHTQIRISRCQEVLDSCEEAFGQEYQVYVDWAAELCGSIARHWHPEHGIISTSYSMADSYTSDGDAITRPPYWCFLIVILLIWWMSMVEELRRVIAHWVVVGLFPTLPPQGRLPVEYSEESIKVNSMAMTHKVITLLANVLPRTIIAIWISIAGSEFLLRADDYENLILNSVALGFLIEIDNMLFAAISSDAVKEWVGRCEPLCVRLPEPQWFRKLHHYCPSRVTFLTVIILVSGWLIAWSYNRPLGKFEYGSALTCLCHVEGRNCLAAQFLGGSSAQVSGRQRPD